MFEYGALLNGSFAEEIGYGFSSLVQTLTRIPPLWYVGGVVLFIALVRLLSSNRMKRK